MISNVSVMLSIGCAYIEKSFLVRGCLQRYGGVSCRNGARYRCVCLKKFCSYETANMAWFNKKKNEAFLCVIIKFCVRAYLRVFVNVEVSLNANLFARIFNLTRACVFWFEYFGEIGFLCVSFPDTLSLVESSWDLICVVKN